VQGGGRRGRINPADVLAGIGRFDQINKEEWKKNNTPSPEPM